MSIALSLLPLKSIASSNDVVPDETSLLVVSKEHSDLFSRHSNLAVSLPWTRRGGLRRRSSIDGYGLLGSPLLELGPCESDMLKNRYEDRSLQETWEVKHIENLDEICPPLKPDMFGQIAFYIMKRHPSKG